MDYCTRKLSTPCAAATIFYAGDIGNAEILERLAQHAPLTAVRGNNDRDAWADGLAYAESLQFGGVFVYLVDGEQVTARLIELRIAKT